MILAFFGVFIGVSLLFQNTPENEIRILIDRPPNTLVPGQNPDVMARKILPLLTEFGYTAASAQAPDLEDFVLLPPSPGRPRLRFVVVKDDLTRGVRFRRNQADVLFDTLSLSKTRLFAEEGSPLASPEGFHLSFLGFRLKHPLLQKREVREAIRLALPVSEWASQKYFGFVDAVPPTPPHALPRFDPALANRMLDQAGIPRDEDGIRFRLRYLTTPVREGNELALLTREALRQIGIQVEVMPLESSLFFSRLQSGEFELFGSRILRRSAADPVGEHFITAGKRNYTGYSNPMLDALLLQNPGAPWPEVAPFLSPDLPVIPLFTWRHGLFLSKRIRFDSIREIPLDDSFRFLASLQLF